MPDIGASTPDEEMIDDTPRPVYVWVTRRGYAWSLGLGVWSEDHNRWFDDRRCSPRRMVSDDVAKFLQAFNCDFDLGQVEIRPFDHLRYLAFVVPFNPALDWFAGLASEGRPEPSLD